MKKLCLQFHMLPVEIGQLLSHLMVEYPIHASLIGINYSLQPTAFKREMFMDIIARGDSCFIAFTINEPNLSCSDRADFNSKNKGTLYLNVGRSIGDVLIESILSGYIEDDALLLKDVYSKFKKSVMSGGVVTNLTTGISKETTKFLYSCGAAKFHGNGGFLKAIAGDNIYIPSKGVTFPIPPT